MTLKEEALSAVEVAVEKLIEAKADLAIDALLKKVEELIPGALDDAIIESQKPKIKQFIKDALLKEAEKISPV